ncbi:MAG: polyphosphate kinase [Candidatus Hydrogenedentes bacterium]|nr:polyphosphate kinase [Candidatus Hydrogenedentota bacterium]
MKNMYRVREVSTLSFNERVLQEAEDTRNPLMERLKFLGIFSSNMDEFFKVRVASVQRRIELGKTRMVPVLDALSQKARELDERFLAAYETIKSGLAAEGIRIFDEADLAQPPAELAAWLDEYFHHRVLPRLVPIILPEGRPFPQLTDGALYFGVKMSGAKPRYAILEIPSDLPRFVDLPNGNIMYIDDVIRHSLNDVFYIFEYERIEAFEFKISRDAQLDIDNDFSEGHVRKMERVLKQRKGGRPTRLVHDAAIPKDLLSVLVKGLRIGEDDTVIAGGRYHNMKDLMRFPARRPDLSFEKMPPAKHPVLDTERRPMLDTIGARDLLLTYPYQSFDHVIRLLREAAIDPDVQSIKMTLYRAAQPSQVVNALVNAMRNGKQVFVSIELQARFDEKNNIEIAQRLTEEGAMVAFGVPSMKVHSKLLLIQRRGRLYAGLSTGNFNESTGNLYVDSMLFTVDKRLTAEVERVFGYLENVARMRVTEAPKFKHLLVSPFNARKVFMRELSLEAAKGSNGYVFIKVNHLTDTGIVSKIQEVADQGVQMDLVVRTTYGVPPHTNIRPISILDRYLEHQRVYIFGKEDDRRVYMSSADLMERNLDWRVEVAFPIYDADLKRLVYDTMALQVTDTHKARLLDESQSNFYVGEGKGRLRAQYATHRYFATLYAAATKAGKNAATHPNTQ